MTKVAILLEQHWNRVPGGTAHAVVGLIGALEGDPRVSLTGVHASHRREPQLPLPNMALTKVPYPGRAMTQSWSRSGRPKIDRWVRSADLLHAPAYVMPETGLPCVATIHDLAFVRHPEWFTPNGVGYLTRFVDRVRSSRCHVMVPSTQTGEDCSAVGIDSERIHLVPWGIDAPVVGDAERADVRQRYGLPEQFVLFVGTVEPRKNLAGLAAAMRNLPDVPFVVVGPDGWGDVEDIDAMRLTDLPRRDLDAVISCAVLLAYPSHFEGFGLPVLEAMAQGTPVVTTKGTAAADLMGGGGIAVDTSSITSLTDAIHSIATDHRLRATLAAEAVDRAAEFSWERTAQLAVEAYEDVLG